LERPWVEPGGGEERGEGQSPDAGEGWWGLVAAVPGVGDGGRLEEEERGASGGEGVGRTEAIKFALLVYSNTNCVVLPTLSRLLPVFVPSRRSLKFRYCSLL